DRFVETLNRYEIGAVPLVRGSVSRFESDRGLKLTLGSAAIPVPAKLDERQRAVCFRGSIVELVCFLSRFLRFRKSFFRLQTTVDDEHVVTVGESCIRGAVVRIDRDGLIEKLDRFLQRVAGSLVPRVATLEIESISLE